MRACIFLFNKDVWRYSWIIVIFFILAINPVFPVSRIFKNDRESKNGRFLWNKISPAGNQRADVGNAFSKKQDIHNQQIQNKFIFFIFHKNITFNIPPTHAGISPILLLLSTRAFSVWTAARAKPCGLSFRGKNSFFRSLWAGRSCAAPCVFPFQGKTLWEKISKNLKNWWRSMFAHNEKALTISRKGLISWRPQGDLNPCRRRERPLSWAG